MIFPKHQENTFSTQGKASHDVENKMLVSLEKWAHFVISRKSVPQH